MSGDGRMAGPGARPPWYVFVLAVLGVLLVLTAIVGFGSQSSSMVGPTPEPVPQPYRGTDTPYPSTSDLGDPTFVTTTTVAPVRKVGSTGAPTTTRPSAATTTTTAPPTTTTDRSVTIVVPDPGSPTYCCGYGGGGYGGGGYGGGRHR